MRQFKRFDFPAQRTQRSREYDAAALERQRLRLLDALEEQGYVVTAMGNSVIVTPGVRL